MATDPFVFYWGKARPSDRASFPYHPAWAHGLDVAAAGRALIHSRPHVFETLAGRLAISQERFEALWLHLLAIHDLGKFSPLFQLKVPTLYPQTLAQPDLAGLGVADPGHPAAGLLLLMHWLEGAAPAPIPPLMEDWPCCDRELFLHPILGHHGRPVAMPQRDWRDLFRPAGSAAAALAYWHAVEAILPAPRLEPLDDRKVAAASWHLAGLTALADWVGSNQAWFPYVAPDTDLSAYWTRACRQAEDAVAAAGLIPAPAGPRLGFRDLTAIPHPPTQTQAWADTVDLPDGPVLTIIEDVTGGGKTEAALTLAHRLLSAGRADGLYFALPTMATSNAMVDRIDRMAPRLFAAEARPSLTLAHGRAALHPRFRKSAEGFAGEQVAGEDDDDSATVAPAWLMGESRRALLADLGVGTVDQAILAVLPNKYGLVRLAGLARKVLILDEIHSYDSYVGAEIERLVAFHAAGGGSTILLSATLPSAAKRKLVEAWRKATGERPVMLNETAYPLATLAAPGTAMVEKPLKARTDLCRALTLTRLPDADAALQRIAAAARAGACVAWIRNTVDDAIDGAAAVRDLGLDADLFHARFAMGDRLAIEKRIVKRFGTEPASDRAGKIVVATQVIEQSLDIDFDLMVSDLAPIDALLQRAGRLWRHRRENRRVDGPELLVVSPDPAGEIAGNWVRAALPRAAAVYQDHGILWRTARVVEAQPSFRVPDDVRPAIEAVYDEAHDGDIPPALERIRNDAIGRRGAERSVAHQNLLVLSDGYRPDGHGWKDEGASPTRLVDDSRRIRLARIEGGRLVPWFPDTDPRMAWALSEVTAYERKLRGRHWPEPRFQAMAEAARRDWSRFEEDVVLLPLEEGEDGVWQGLLVNAEGQRMEAGYSRERGLVL